MKDISIAVAGNQWITKYLVDELVATGIQPSVIINMPSEKSADISGYYDLRPIAQEYSIDVYTPETYGLKSEKDQELLGNIKVDILLVFGWQRLIPEWFINQISLGVYGVHGGPEKPPRCRGRAVFNWAMLLGYTHFYMYMFRITPGVDEGDILEMTAFDIHPADDVLTLYHKNCIVSSQMMIRQLPLIASGQTTAIPQDEEGATYLPKRTEENGGIYWDWTAERVINLIRAVAPPYPGAFTYLDGKKVKITRAHLFDSRIRFEKSIPGQITEVFPNGDFIVMTSDFPVYIRTYENEENASILKNAVFELRSGAHPEDPVL